MTRDAFLDPFDFSPNERKALTVRDERPRRPHLGPMPWHGIGQVIPRNATIEETARAAGMNWNVGRVPVSAEVLRTVTLPDGREEQRPHHIDMPTRCVLFRDDTYAPLAVIGYRFKETQPRHALELFRKVAKTLGYVIESAGTLRGGALMFAVANPSGFFELPGGDRVEYRLLLSAACDAMYLKKQRITIRTASRTTLRAPFDGFDATAHAMASKQVTSAAAGELLAAILPSPQRGAVGDSRAFKQAMALFEGAAPGSELKSARGTAWGLLNAVAQYVDHERFTRDPSARKHSALFGSGADLKERALNMIVKSL